MILELNFPNDVMVKYRSFNFKGRQKIVFRHLTKTARKAIRLVGRGFFATSVSGRSVTWVDVPARKSVAG